MFWLHEYVCCLTVCSNPLNAVCDGPMDGVAAGWEMANRLDQCDAAAPKRQRYPQRYGATLLINALAGTNGK